jgi:RNA polymerase sigma-70 factor (sigma-E family)
MRTIAGVASPEGAVTEGDRLEELYRLHAPDAVRLAYLLCGSRPLADDLVQEAFVRLFGRFRDLRDPGAFPWYLRRTVVNLVRSHFRHAQVEQQYVERTAQERTDALESPDPADRDELWRALLRLPERQRTAIVLRYYEDLSEVQTAEAMACPVGTVKSLVSRGIGRLREIVSKGDSDGR